MQSALKWQAAACGLGLSAVVVLTLTAGRGAATQSPAEGTASEVVVTEATAIAAALSPDKRTLVVQMYGGLYALPVTGGEARPLGDGLFRAGQPTFAPDGRTVAFESNRNGSFDLWTMTVSDGQSRAVTSGPFDDREPHWSPDGKVIAFASDRSGNYDIWRFEVATAEVRQVTTDEGDDFAPTWSPDGREIAFVSTRASAPGIYAVTPSNGRERLVLRTEGRVGTPSWTPDGRQQVFQLFEEGRSRLVLDGTAVSGDEDVSPSRVEWLSDQEYLYTADGGIKRRRLRARSAETVQFQARLPVRPPAYTRTSRDFDSSAPRRALGIIRPSISPDASQVAFAALGDLWLMPIGSTPQRLTDDPFVETDPAWSPDGGSLVYASDRGGTLDLWIRDVASGRERRLTDAPGSEIRPAWAPDGRRIAYVNAFGTYQGEIFVVDVTSGVATRIQEASFGPGYPTWSPDGSLVMVSRLKSYSLRERQGTNQPFTIPASGGAGRFIVPVPHKSIGKRSGDGPSWSPDGRHIAFNLENRLWVLPVTPTGDPAGQPRQIADHPADYLSWTGDSQRVLGLVMDRLRLVGLDGTGQDVPLELTWTRQAPAGRLVVHAGQLADLTADRVLPNMDIVIERNRIRAVEPHRDGLHDGSVIDASGLTAIPGLIDAHAHLMKHYGDRFGRIHLAYGVTSVRSPANIPSDVIEEREAFAAGRRPGPRVFATGYLIDGPRVYWEVSSGVSSEREVDVEIERARRLEYDFVKTYGRLPEPLRKYVVEAAHRIGLPVSSHEWYPAASYGMDSKEHHFGDVRQDFVDVMVRSQMTLTPTLSLGGISRMKEGDPDIFEEPRWRLLQPPWDQSPSTRRFGDRSSAQGDRVLAELARAGRIVAGTDAPLIPYGVSVHNELERQVQAGLTPFEALQTATIHTARLLNAAADLGTIEPGKLADIVLVEGQPLSDVRDARNIRYVIKNGELFDSDALIRPGRTRTPSER